MLLEYCEGGTMKDWLTDNKMRVNDDVIERLFRFTYDIARGMEFLASKEVYTNDIWAGPYIESLVIEADVFQPLEFCQQIR